MALELLAGPFDLTHGVSEYLSQGQAARFSSLGNPFWVDEIGLIGAAYEDSSGDYIGIGIAQMDGPFYPRTDILKWPRLIWDGKRQGLMDITDASSNKYPYLFDTMICDTTELAADSYASGTNNSVARLPDRYIRVTSGKIQYADLNAGVNPPFNDELDSLSGSGNGSAVISPHGPGKVAIGWGNGVINVYDTQQKKEVGKWTSIGMNNIGIWASPTHKVYISLHEKTPGGAQEIRVWGRETRPDSVSAPVAVDTIKAGDVSTVRVQVLGDQGEACADHLVNWSITAGPGEFVHDQSRTDENGNADVEYVCPPDATGNVDIQAEVKF